MEYMNGGRLMNFNDETETDGLDFNFDDFEPLERGEDKDASGPGWTEDHWAYGIHNFLLSNYQGALKNFDDAVAKGDIRAFYFMGLIYAEGLGVPEDIDKARELWSEGKKQGNELCELVLMDEEEFLDTFEGPDSDEAIQKALKKLEEDTDENLFYGFQLSKLCSDYESVLLDEKQKKESLKASADKGNVLAMYELYKYYVDDREFEKADETLKRAADFRYPAAMIKLGELFENGLDNHPEDVEKALELYSMANSAHSKTADLHLGLLNFKLERYRSAFTHMKRAAKAGFPEAMYKLGLMYQHGWGIRSAKPDEASEWIKRAADSGCDSAVQYLKQSVGKEDSTSSVKSAESESATLVVKGITGAEQITTKYAVFIESLHSNGMSRLQAAQKVVGKIIGDIKIAHCMFWPNIDENAIEAANNNYAGRNKFVLAILDDAPVPKFYGKNGVMITSDKLISSQNQNFNVHLDSIQKVSIVDKVKDKDKVQEVLEISTKEGNCYEHVLKKSFNNNKIIIEDFILAMVYMAQIYRS